MLAQKSLQPNAAFGSGRFTQRHRVANLSLRCSATEQRSTTATPISASSQGTQSQGSSIVDILLPRWSKCAAAAIALTSVLACSEVQAAYAPAMAYDDLPQEAVMSPEEAKYDENLMTKELKSFLELLDKQGNSIKFEELQAQREKLGFRRTADGRVSLHAPKGHWYSVKADLQAPGFLLLRDESDSTMHYLPPDDSGQLMQVDLSDDAIVAQLFASGAWYDVMDPLKVQEGRQLVPLRMTAAEFRVTSSLLADAIEEEDGQQLQLQ